MEGLEEGGAVLLDFLRAHSFDAREGVFICRGVEGDEFQGAVVADAVWGELLLARELHAGGAEAGEAGEGFGVKFEVGGGLKLLSSTFSGGSGRGTLNCARRNQVCQ